MSNCVLVLNANYEPIHVCNLSRAMGLLLTDKAQPVILRKDKIHTPEHSFPRPSIIRLQYQISRPRPGIHPKNREIFRRDQYTCQYCGRRYPSMLTIDHVIPRSRGGKNTWTNLVTACAECNHRKGNRTLGEANMRLLRTPTEPSYTASYYFESHLKDYSEWEPFLAGW